MPNDPSSPPSSQHTASLAGIEFETEIPAAPPGVQLFHFPSGLSLIVCEDRSAPVVSAQAWCHTGSIHEGDWIGAGLSHVLEHMLFKGTTRRPSGKIDQEVQDAGGYMNAFTSFDRTVYYINVPNTGTRVAVDILADIMQHATLPAPELERELDVIRREMDMSRDDPGRLSSRRLFEVAYTRSPYRYPIIGLPDVFNQLGSDDILNYYRQRYVPNNMFFVVAGDVSATDVRDQIAAAFAEAKLRPLPPTVLPAEPKQAAPRDVVDEGKVELGHWHCSWHIPDLRHPDTPVLDVLSTIMGFGRSARFYRTIREGRALAHSIDCWTYSPGSDGLFGASALIDPHNLNAIQGAVTEEVDRLRQDGVSEAELQRAIKQATAATLSTRKTMQGIAFDLGSNWLTANDLSFSERYLAAVRRCTTADLLRVARTHLTADNRTRYALVPSGTWNPANTSVATPTEQPIQRSILSNGACLLLKRAGKLPFVDVRVVFQGGVLSESAESNGVTQLLSRVLPKGTESRTAEEIALAIESVGGSLDAYSGNNSIGASAEVLKDDYELAIDLVLDILLKPAFPDAVIDRERQSQLAAIKAERDQLLHAAFRTLRTHLFAGKGYGLDPLGSEKTVNQLDSRALARHHRRLIRPENCVFAVYGDIDPDAILNAVESRMDSWREAAGGETADDASRPRRGRVNLEQTTGDVAAPPRVDPMRVVETHGKTQAVIVLGFPGLTFYDSERYALDLIQEACSDLGSRLFTRIREELGLAYYVGAQHFAGLQPGYFTFYAGTNPDQADLVEKELLAEADLLRKNGLSDEELRRAKAKVIGQKKISRQDINHYAMVTALDELFGLGYETTEHEADFYEAVTEDQIRQAADRFLIPEKAVIVRSIPENQSEPSPSN